MLVVSIVGPLTKENQPIFKECNEEILKLSSKWIILNFRDVSPLVDLSYIELLDQLQKKIREKPAFLRLSGVHPELRKVLQEKQIVRPEELVNNLSEALSSLPPTKPNP